MLTHWYPNKTASILQWLSHWYFGIIYFYFDSYLILICYQYGMLPNRQQAIIPTSDDCSVTCINVTRYQWVNTSSTYISWYLCSHVSSNNLKKMQNKMLSFSSQHCVCLWFVTVRWWQRSVDTVLFKLYIFGSRVTWLLTWYIWIILEWYFTNGFCM